MTTTPDRFEDWAEPLRRAGLEPVGLPCIEVEPAGSLEAGRALAEMSDLTVVTSPRTIRLIWPEGGMTGLKVAAVGPATARAATAAGAVVVAEGRGGAHDVVDRLAGRIDGMRVTYLHARGADPGVAERLRSGGADVAARAVYATRSIAPGRDPVEAAVFGSPSAVKGWAGARPFPSTVGAIGSTTAAALGQDPTVTMVMPAEPGTAALAAALEAHWAVHR